jgi:predicted DNA-binding transcriptional regulator AlpA
MKNTQPDSTKMTYTLEETAALFGKNRSWAYRQVSAGRLKVITGYGAMLVPKSEIQRILDSAAPIK